MILYSIGSTESKQETTHALCPLTLVDLDPSNLAHQRYLDYGEVTHTVKSKVNTDIPVRNRNYHTATGNHMPYGITQCYLPPGRGDFPILPLPKLVLDLATPEGCKAGATN